MSMEQRVTELEQRVASLESLQRTSTTDVSAYSDVPTEEEATGLAARVDSAARPTTGLPTNTENVFWALLELGHRNGRPASNGSVMIVGDVTTPDGRIAQWQLEATTDDIVAQNWDELAGTFAALGSPVRLAILKAVISGDATTAKELSNALTANSIGQIYHHLKELTAAGWLTPTSNKGFTVPAGRLVPLLTTLLGGAR